MGSKRKNQSKGASIGGGGAEQGQQMISDPRFSSAHTDPRFRRLPMRDSKVPIDPRRFPGVLTDKASAPVDKRGKRRRGASAKDSLREYYRIEEDDDEKKKKKKRKMEESEEEESGDEGEAAQEDEIKSESLNVVDSSDEESDEESESDGSVEVSEEDTDEDDEAIYEDDGPEVEEENITNIEKETHRLAIVRMDWRHVSAKDLYVVLNSFVPKDGRILSVAVYPTDFGLERMKEEEIHGPAIDGDRKKEDDDDDEEEEEEDEDVNNEKLRDYEKSRLKYYHAVAECDSAATADFLYKSCDGLEFEKSSNKLDLRFIPDSMEFKHPPRDIATEAPSNYEGLDFQSRALQLSKVNLSWDEDEPHRIKTLNQKFNPDQLAELEMKEFLASDESESDEDNNEASKKEKRKEKYRALIESEDAGSDKDGEEEENGQDMEVTFNTGLEDLSKQIRERKDKKSETVWDAYLRKKSEKKRARKNKQKDDSSSSDEDDYNVDGKAVKDDGDDDFFMEEPRLKKKKKKEGKTDKKKKGLEEEVATEERSRAELELLLADENGGDGLKGYNIKRKGKKRSKEEMAEEKIPAVDLDDIKERFSAAISDPDFALDPTDPQFKRSAIYVRQLAQKHKEDPRSHEEAKATVKKAKEESTKDGKLGSKSYAESIAVKSLKLKIQQKDSDKKKAATAGLAQRMKNKAKALSNK
ncbi:hypothetical protein EUTSA_v10020182mg [Eutrema salsugineum]|uniref:Uncharacterized protein n=1 Tax=Eutrema salsugineum TaxID=72664 RepID=V4LHB2_EUTSA|nr:pre-rRNA-processing protein ESF1 [Eutrema salsugineum]ESQ49920.1 hypothetical protein EUTSA_v10020182mg [Eutrema salsugineum]